MCKDIWIHLQESELMLTIFYIPVQKALTLPGNQEADSLAQVQT